MRRLGICAYAVVLGALTPLPAGAQQAETGNVELAKARARALANRGAELFEAGQYAEALEAFREAEQRYHAPTILVMVARCHERLGQLLEARSTYERVVAEPVPTWGPQAFREAQATAKANLEELERRIPMLEIRVTGAAASAVTLSVNGVSVAADGEAIARDPGRTVVVASVAGRPPIQREINLEEGRTERLTLDLSPKPVAVPAAAAPDATARGPVLPAYIAFGVAGLGLGIGTVTGVMAKVAVDDIKSRCTPDGHCPRADQPKADRAQTLITVSTVGFVVGGLAAGAGVTLLVLRPGGGAQKAPKDAAVRVVVGPGSAHVVGRF